MFIIVALLIMLSIYVVKNDKISEQHKTGWFIVLAIVLILFIIFTFLF